MWKWLLAALVVWSAWNHFAYRPVHHPPGIVAPDDPLQAPLQTSLPLSRGAWSITPLARFEARARVLASERYRFDHLAPLVPVDLALGWGPMSDSAVLDAIDIEQRARFYYWRVAQFPIPEREIIEHSANMHLIPATAHVERLLKNVRPGQIVSFSGYLVEARDASGWNIRSSLTRSDTGAGACEVVWVEDLQVGSL